MTSAYVMERKCESNFKLENIPKKYILSKTGESVVFDVYNDSIDYDGLYKIFVEVIDEGKTYPQETIDREGFRSYFLSHHCFVVRLEKTNETIAGVYLKPNFPGRSSHIANGGLIVRMDYRANGVGDILMKGWIDTGRQLGYDALYTNLVFVTNSASIALLKRYGFIEIGRLPRAGNLKGLGYVDALQLYKSLKE